jgi:hypothetical protein
MHQRRIAVNTDLWRFALYSRGTHGIAQEGVVPCPIQFAALAVDEDQVFRKNPIKLSVVEVDSRLLPPGLQFQERLINSCVISPRHMQSSFRLDAGGAENLAPLFDLSDLKVVEDFRIAEERHRAGFREKLLGFF